MITAVAHHVPDIRMRDLDYVPEGVCEMAGFTRHYCHNAARCELIADGVPYLSCDVCRRELGVTDDSQI